jgi:hypothetical protein
VGVILLNASDKKVLEKLINSDSNNQQNLLKDFAAPIAAAIIAAAAAGWSFFQARWNGRYFQKLILEELSELEPNNKEIRNEKTILKSHYMSRIL